MSVSYILDITGVHVSVFVLCPVSVSVSVSVLHRYESLLFAGASCQEEGWVLAFLHHVDLRFNFLFLEMRILVRMNIDRGNVGKKVDRMVGSS